MAEKILEVGGEKKKKKGIVLAVVFLILVLGLGFFFFSKEKRGMTQAESETTWVEYSIPEAIYQLKNGSYLRLSFSIVVKEPFLEVVKEILEISSPAKLNDSLNSILGNKTREDLIGSSLRRENFRSEIQQVLETQVFQDYNRKQHSPHNRIEVRDILLETFVTQVA